MEKSYLLVSSEELTNIQKQLAEIKELLLKRDENIGSGLGDWITEKETMKLLGKRSTSLYKLRISEELVATKTRPIYYSFKSIQEYLERMAEN